MIPEAAVEAAACDCAPIFGQVEMTYSAYCDSHERCPTLLPVAPIQCALISTHTGTHK